MAQSHVTQSMQSISANPFCSEHQRVVEELARSDKFRKCLENMVDGYSMLESVRDNDGRIIDFRYYYANDDACRNMGVSRERFLQSTLYDIHPYFWENGFFDKFCHTAETGEPLKRLAFYHSNQSDSRIKRHFDINVLKVDDGIALNWRDVTELREATENLRSSQELFHNAFHSGGAMMSIVELPNQRCIEINKPMLDLLELSREEVIGRTIWEVTMYASEMEKYTAFYDTLIEKGTVRNYEIAMRTKSGKIVTLLRTSTLAYVQGKQCIVHIGQDITKEKEYEAEMQRFDRLNLVGEIAASIGHEVRNPMTTVRGYLQLFQRRSEFEPYTQQLDTMIEELDRANNIITEFLSLAKNKRITLKTGNLNDVIHVLFPLIQADGLRMGCDATLQLEPVPNSHFDTGEMRQLILNLTRNSLEAMKDKGVVTIRTYWDSEGINLEVQDTGPGFPDHVLKELGKPFVTTKENGTGLGLPVCYRIAQRHKGELRIQSSPGSTVVRVVFKR